MKKSKLLLFLVIAFSILMVNSKVLAITLPDLAFSYKNHAVGDKMDWEFDSNLAVGETLQLYAFIGYGNEMCDDPEDCGWFVEEANLSGITWESSNPAVATVDNNGKITAVSVGDASISAFYKDYSQGFDVKVTLEKVATPTESDNTSPVDSGDNTTTEPVEDVTTQPSDTTTTDQNDIAPAPEKNTTTESNNNTIIVVAVVGGLLLVGAAVWYFSKNKKNG